MTIDGIRLVDEGNGPPLLLLHGNPDTGDMWQELIEALKDRHRCLAPDLPGFGGSTVPAGFAFTLDDMAVWVEDLIAKLELSAPISLVVHDFGGPFGLAYAARYAERVAHIIIINTIFHAEYRWHFWARVWRTPVLGELSMALMNRPLFRREVKRGGLPADYVDRTYAALTPATKRTILRLYRSVTPQEFGAWQDRLAATIRRVPTLVLWGDLDPYIPKHFADRFGARKVVHLPTVGHWPPVETPDRVAAEIAAFIRSMAS